MFHRACRHGRAMLCCRTVLTAAHWLRKAGIAGRIQVALCLQP